jgi:hypothetical protein
MPPRKVNSAFLAAAAANQDVFVSQPSNSPGSSSKRALGALRSAAQTGNLTLAHAQLVAFPADLWRRNDPPEEDEDGENLTQTSSDQPKWWEREPMQKIDLSFNDIGAVPRELGDDKELCEELRSLILAHNQIASVPGMLVSVLCFLFNFCV